MINENIEVLIISFPDPYNDNYHDYLHRCALKDSLNKMDEHLNKLNLNSHERLGYQFSVLMREDSGYKLVYSYTGDRKIMVKEEFKGMLHFTPQLMVEVHKVLLS